MMRQNLTIQPLQNMTGHVTQVALIIYDVSAQAQDREQLLDANTKLEHLSQVDPLTGLANRRQWQEVLEREFDRCRRYHPPGCLLILDVDHFKVVNDTYGHDSGDKVLHELAQVLRARLRKTDIVARYGGEEFAILLTETQAEPARLLAEQLRKTISELSMPDSVPSITVSIGLCPFHSGLKDIADWFNQADKALYQAKEEGRNRLVVAPHQSGQEQA